MIVKEKNREGIFMKYMGSKNAIAKEIIPIMETVRSGRTWVEPLLVVQI